MIHWRESNYTGAVASCIYPFPWVNKVPRAILPVGIISAYIAASRGAPNSFRWRFVFFFFAPNFFSPASTLADPSRGSSLIRFAGSQIRTTPRTTARQVHLCIESIYSSIKPSTVSILSLACVRRTGSRAAD